MGACLGCCWYCSVVKSCWLSATPWTVPTRLSVCGIYQARLLEWAAISFSRVPDPRSEHSLLGKHLPQLPGKMGLQYHRQTLGGTPGLWLTTSPGGSSIRDGRQEALLSRNQLTFSNRLHAGAQRGHTPENTWEFRISSQIMQRKFSLHEIWPQSLESWLILQMLKFRHEK